MSAYLTARPLWRPDFLGRRAFRRAPGDETRDYRTDLCRRRRREAAPGAQTAALGVLMAVSASHMLNDVMQSLAPALYPVFREKMALSFFQTGIITFVFQSTASLLQPFSASSPTAGR